MVAGKIDSFEDILAALDENPDWVEALRSRLLTKELLEMPNTLARFMETVNQRVEPLEKRFDELTAIVKSLANEVGRVRSDGDTLKHDLSDLKDIAARGIAERDYPIIAYDMGLDARRVVPLAEFFKIAVSMRRSGQIDRDTFLSFRRADIVIEAEDSEANTTYVMVEASYTVHDGDIQRAHRNARLMKSATGTAARGAVAGVALNPQDKGMIESGDVYWHKLEPNMLKPE